MKRLLLGLFSALAVIGLVAAAEIGDLNTSDASNTARFPENMAPSAVNDGARALEGMLARAFKDTLDGIVTTGGTATAYTAAANRTLTSLYDGLEMSLSITPASGASPTLAVDGLSAQSLVWPDGTAVGSGEIPAGAIVRVKYDSTNSRWAVQTLPSKAQKELITTRGDLIRGSSSGTSERLALGSSGQYVRSDGTDAAWSSIVSGDLPTATTSAAGAVEEATQAEMESETDSKFPDAASIKYSPGVAKAWALFDGTGTPSLTASYNFDSITDNGTGDYSLTFTTAFSTSNYACVPNVVATIGGLVLANIHSRATTAVRVITQNTGGTAQDTAAVYVVCFGDQ